MIIVSDAAAACLGISTFAFLLSILTILEVSKKTKDSKAKIYKDRYENLIKRTNRDEMFRRFCK